MIYKVVLISTLSLLATSCVMVPAVEGDEASLRSNHAVISFDGKTIAEKTELRLQPGTHTVQVVYRTHLHDYICHFEWTVDANRHYEIVDHENASPLTLYRWERQNALWAELLEPVHPDHCKKK